MILLGLLLNVHFDIGTSLFSTTCSMSLFPIGQECAVQLFESTHHKIIVSLMISCYTRDLWCHEVESIFSGCLEDIQTTTVELIVSLGWCTSESSLQPKCMQSIIVSMKRLLPDLFPSCVNCQFLFDFYLLCCNVLENSIYSGSIPESYFLRELHTINMTHGSHKACIKLTKKYILKRELIS